MLLAQAFAEYLGFVECVGAAKLWDGSIEAKLRYGHTPFPIGAGWMAFELIANRIHHPFGALKNDVNESGDAMEMTP